MAAVHVSLPSDLPPGSPVTDPPRESDRSQGRTNNTIPEVFPEPETASQAFNWPLVSTTGAGSDDRKQRKWRWHSSLHAILHVSSRPLIGQSYARAQSR